MRERERERERARVRGEASDGEIASLIAISPSRDRAGSRSRSTVREEDPRSRHVVCRPRDPRGRSVEEDREIREEDPSIAISPSRDRAIDREEGEITIAPLITIDGVTISIARSRRIEIAIQDRDRDHGAMEIRDRDLSGSQS